MSVGFDGTGGDIDQSALVPDETHEPIQRPDEHTPAPQPVEPAPADWFDDEQAQLAQQYGLSEHQAREFGSADEFSRALRIFDAHLINQSMLQQQQQMPPGQQQPGQQMQPQQPAVVPQGPFEFDFEKDQDLFMDEADKARWIGLRDHFNQQLDHMRQAAEERQQLEAMRAFDRMVDQFEDPRLGNSDDGSHRSQQAFNYRNELYALCEHLAYQTGQSPQSRSVVNRAKEYFNARFGQPQLSPAQTQAALNQRRKVRPTTSRPNANDAGFEGEIEDHPAIAAAYEKARIPE